MLLPDISVTAVGRVASVSLLITTEEKWCSVSYKREKTRMFTMPASTQYRKRYFFSPKRDIYSAPKV